MLSVLKCQINFGDLAALLNFQLTSIFTSCHLTKHYVKDKLGNLLGKLIKVLFK